MLRKIFFSDRIIILAILINAALIFWMAFPQYSNEAYLHNLEWVFTLFFTLELIYKMFVLGPKNYLKDGFNKLDFIIVLFSIPSLGAPFFSAVRVAPFTILRLLRLVRLARLLVFVPNMMQLIQGIKRALKASIFVLIACFLYNFMLAIISCQFFYQTAPQYFGDPMISFYTVFQLFTVEGWNEISDAIANNSSGWNSGLIRMFFMGVVLSGGIFGLSIANAVFVDEMTMDNNSDLEDKIDLLNTKIDRLEKLLEK